ncbi:NusA-like transcription termination signal-binding factor [archaeon]|jgi:NusA-like KH domain protein|nr:NusA-like transcription termination signal-binding factor [archaeon]MBT3451528.1 NusA-like transcription termination signal-binding factor [archaeon]MBT6869387.1 NusA-like transcription termination signal-binding factor [archaeon]MBT7192550.1 NusA-like transcription termination signal-binding factor [archaeon]MBT7380626.1 NusA-like transcription termination signal-binding factor [archaeon]
MAKRVKVDMDSFAYTPMFERLAKVKVRACFDGGDILYVVLSPGFLRKAIGKNGETIKRFSERVGKKIKLAEYNLDIKRFIKNIIYPLQVEDIEVFDDHVIIKDSSKKTKSLLIGRDAKNLKMLNDIVGRFFNKDVKIG